MKHHKLNARHPDFRRMTLNVTINSGQYDQNDIYRYSLTITPNGDEKCAYKLEKRYSDFSNFRKSLPKGVRDTLPFPQKCRVNTVCGCKMSPTALEERRIRLTLFIKAVAQLEVPFQSEMHHLRMEFLGIPTTSPVLKSLPVGRLGQQKKNPKYCPVHTKIKVIHHSIFGSYEEPCDFCEVARLRRLLHNNDSDTKSKSRRQISAPLQT
jgi:hypothetical protein